MQEGTRDVFEAGASLPEAARDAVRVMRVATRVVRVTTRSFQVERTQLSSSCCNTKTRKLPYDVLRFIPKS